MGSIYKCNMSADERCVVEALRQRLAVVGWGVTIQGNRVTLRWYEEDDDGTRQLVNVHMIIENVQTPKESRSALDASKIMQKILKKHPEENAELFFLEHGEYEQ